MSSKSEMTEQEREDLRYEMEVEFAGVYKGPSRYDGYYEFEDDVTALIRGNVVEVYFQDTDETRLFEFKNDHEAHEFVLWGDFELPQARGWKKGATNV